MTLREVRSFVLRQGRKTDAQQNAIDAYWMRFGLSVSQGVIDLKGVFGREAPLIVDIGFGMGDALVEMALRCPQYNFIGIDVHTPGVGSLLNQLALQDVQNVRVYKEDAVLVLKDVLHDHSVAGVQLFFPDPWPKRKHHKRRLIQPSFLDLLKRKLTQDGFCFFVSDWADYVESVRRVFDGDEYFGAATESSLCRLLYGGRLETKFERKGLQQGRDSEMLFYQLEQGC